MALLALLATWRSAECQSICESSVSAAITACPHAARRRSGAGTLVKWDEACDRSPRSAAIQPWASSAYPATRRRRARPARRSPLASAASSASGAIRVALLEVGEVEGVDYSQTIEFEHLLV